MVTITAKFETRRLIAFTNRAKKNLVFSAVQGINDTAKLIQRKMRDRAGRVFTLRKEKFIRRQIAIIKPFASVKTGTLFAVVSVGQKKRLLLTQFERGGERKPVKGKRVAVPVTGGPARPSFRQPVLKQFTFRQLKLRKSKKRGGLTKKRTRGQVKFAATRTGRGKVQWKGRLRTFILQETRKAPEGGVYQRVGPGRDDIRLIYSFARNVKIPQRLRFKDTAKKIGRKNLSKIIASKFRKSNKRR